MSLTITIPGAVNVTTGSFAPAVLTIGVGVPGAQGPQGPAGQGVPAGGSAGQFLQKIDGVSYNTDWVTVNLGAYAVKANNLSDLTSASTARTNLGLGTMATATAADYSTTTAANGLYYPLTGNPSSFLTASALTGYATQSFVAANYAPIAAGLPTGGTVGQVLTKNSGTNFDVSFQTLIPGDRYLTTSSTSNTIGNGAKTFTVGTGLSYSNQQDVVISYDATNHMHALVTSYNSGTGVLVVDVQHHTGSGTYTAWTVNVGGTTPLQSVEWGEILGTLGDQSDLASALNGKLESTTAASTYAALAGATFTGEVVTPASTTSNAGLTIMPGVAPSTPTNGEIWATTNDLQIRLNGVTETLAEQSWVTAQGYLTSAPVTSVAGRTGAITLAVGDVSGAAALAGATFTGLVNTLASSTAGAGFRLPHGAAPTTPTDGDVWSTTGGLFWRQNAATKQAMNLGDTQTVSGNITFSNGTLTLGSSTGASTYNLGSGATTTGITKAINIGTAGASGSTTNITVGPVAGTSTTNIGNTTAASTLNLATGATLTTLTKAINIGTNGVSGSTTNINIGASPGTSTTTIVGTAIAQTVAVDTNNTNIATTAYVVGQAGSATPLVNGTAAVGTSLRYARQDHVHGTDTTRAPLASPTFTGTPLSTTAAVDTNTTQIATTAYVVGQGYLKSATAASTYAPLASPTFTGTPSLPTGTTAVTQTVGNNTTAVATTAFVLANAGSTSFATNAQVVAATSTTTAIAPSNQGFLMTNPRLQTFAFINSAAASGSGASTTSNPQNFSRQIYLNSLAVGRSAYIFGVIGVATAGFGTSTAKADQVDFSKKVWISGYACMGWTGGTSYIGDANTMCRITLGGYSTNTTGDMTLKGIGLKKVGGAASTVSLTVHNGTTLTDVASSVTVPDGGGIHWQIYSDGTGNVTLYINGTQAATTTAGPTTATASGSACYREQVEAAVTPGVRQVMNCNGGWFYTE